MVPEMNCVECQEQIQEVSLLSENALELSAALSASAQMHLRECAACREACAEFFQLDTTLGGLSGELPAPDMRGSVMARIRADFAEREGVELEAVLATLSLELPAPDVRKAVMARVRAGRSVEPFAAGEVVCVMVALTVGTAGLAPTWLPWFGAATEWLASLSGIGFSLPEVPLDPVRDMALLTCLLLACIWQTRAWLEVRHS